MKLGLTILLTSVVVILGCKAPEPPVQEIPASEQAAVEIPQTPGTEKAEAGYVNGSWISNWNDAQHYAAQMERPILINFTGSDWCPWCFRLRDEVFVMDAFKDYASQNLILMTVDFPRNIRLPQDVVTQNNSLQARYSIEGYPTILLVDAEGNELARTGYMRGGATAYVAHLQSLLAEAAN